MRSVLITGATSGIGRATAMHFAEKGVPHLVLCGRRKEKLNALQKEIESKYSTDTFLLTFDIRNAEMCKEAYESIPSAYKPFDLLINNAGLAQGLDPIHKGDFSDWDTMIDTNVKGLLYISKFAIQDMVTAEKGHVINVASTAGKETYPGGNVYCASKHAVDALTRAMRLDLYKHGIRVGQVAPGHVEETDFAERRFHWNKEKANIYEDFNPLTSRDVAEAIYFIASRPAHVNIQDILLMGTQQANSTNIDRSGRKYDE